mmetsp:Transcript_108673/g.337622  ORF Transcript_108673/g.337622 Transcript_108673/m.337622 type:complete len:338 (-) Transcript_108673:263-1276(-)
MSSASSSSFRRRAASSAAAFFLAASSSASCWRCFSSRRAASLRACAFASATCRLKAASSWAACHFAAPSSAKRRSLSSCSRRCASAWISACFSASSSWRLRSSSLTFSLGFQPCGRTSNVTGLAFRLGITMSRFWGTSARPLMAWTSKFAGTPFLPAKDSGFTARISGGKPPEKRSPSGPVSSTVNSNRRMPSSGGGNSIGGCSVICSESSLRITASTCPSSVSFLLFPSLSAFSAPPLLALLSLLLLLASCFFAFLASFFFFFLSFFPFLASFFFFFLSFLCFFLLSPFFSLSFSFSLRFWPLASLPGSSGCVAATTVRMGFTPRFLAWRKKFMGL